VEILTGNGQRHDISTLSGGQKTVLALAFILACQKNSPAKFYLFDEIDRVNDSKI